MPSAWLSLSIDPIETFNKYGWNFYRFFVAIFDEMDRNPRTEGIVPKQDRLDKNSNLQTR